MAEAVIQQLVEMGFTEERAKMAVSKCGEHVTADTATEWILTNEEEPAEPVPVASAPAAEPSASSPANTSSISDNMDSSLSTEPLSPPKTAHSIKCTECGKLFSKQEEVDFHAGKSGHTKFEESTEEKKPLTEEEKKDQLAKIEAKLRQRRMEREEREKQEAIERERTRIKVGKEIHEAKQKHNDLEIQKMVEQRKREKEQDRIDKQRVLDQIEQDKQARKAKLSGVPIPSPPKPVPVVTTPKPAQNYSDVKLQIRLPNGGTLSQTFGAKEPLSAVRVFVEMNRTDAAGAFNLMTSFPKKVFEGDDYEQPLETLGLAPSAVLIVSRV